MRVKKEINSAIFREYDVRGIYDLDIDEDVSYTVGKAFGSYVQIHGLDKVIVGHDNRESYKVIYPALINGLLDSGVDVISLGYVTTPMHNYAKIYLNAFAAIMVTASHNPKEYNGFKISMSKNDSLFGKDLQDFKKFLDKYEYMDGEGKIESIDIFPSYLDDLKKSLDFGDRKVNVIVDCGNGTGSLFIRNIMKEFNINCQFLFCESDSNFPNHVPDPAVKDNLKVLGDTVREFHFDLGVSVDGDCDRCGLVLEDGSFVSADMIMALFYRDLASKMKVKKGVFDVKCSLSLIDEIKKLGLKPCMNRTGSVYCRRYVSENDLFFGGEYSGHLFFRDRYLGYDDGIYGILRIIELLSKTDKKISELFEGMNHYFSTEEIKIRVRDDNKFKIVDEVIDYAKEKSYNFSLVDGIRVMFDDGWALVRASNTGPDLTVRFEAKTERRLKEIQNEFTLVIDKVK